MKNENNFPYSSISLVLLYSVLTILPGTEKPAVPGSHDPQISYFKSVEKRLMFSYVL